MRNYLRLARGISGFLSDMMKVNGVLGVSPCVVLTVGLWSAFGALLFSGAVLGVSGGGWGFSAF